MTGWAEFITARLGEDEAAANYVHAPIHCHRWQYGAGECTCGYPARVRRQVQAMREILELADEADEIHYDRCIETGTDLPGLADPPGTLIGVQIRQALASAWSDHPDYGKAGG